MEKRQGERGLLDLAKLSFDNLKKKDQEKQCHFKDFPPLLEYSPWHFFELVVERCVQRCRKSQHFEDHSMEGFQVAPHGALLEDPIVKKLSKGIPMSLPSEKSIERKLKVKTLKEDDDRPLHELVAHKRIYSNLSES